MNLSASIKSKVTLPVSEVLFVHVECRQVNPLDDFNSMTVHWKIIEDESSNNERWVMLHWAYNVTFKQAVMWQVR